MPSSFRKPIAGVRFAPGTRVDGHWVEGATTPLNIMASVQPASGEDLESLPINRRSGAVYKIFSDTPLQTVDELTSRNPDRLTLHDGDYEVVAVAPWQNNVINHYRYLVARPSRVQPA